MHIFTKSSVLPAYKIEKTVHGVKCDRCGKVIQASSHDSSAKYYKVITRRDEIDRESQLIEDLCDKCIDEYFSEFLKTNSTSACFEVRTRRIYPIRDSTYMDYEPTLVF